MPSAEKLGLTTFFRVLSVDCWRLFAQLFGRGLTVWLLGAFELVELVPVGIEVLVGVPLVGLVKLVPVGIEHT